MPWTRWYYLPCRGKRLPRIAIVVSLCCLFGLAESVAVTRFEIGNDSSSVTIPVTDGAGLVEVDLVNAQDGLNLKLEQSDENPRDVKIENLGGKSLGVDVRGLKGHIKFGETALLQLLTHEREVGMDLASYNEDIESLASKRAFLVSAAVSGTISIDDYTSTDNSGTSMSLSYGDVSVNLETNLNSATALVLDDTAGDDNDSFVAKETRSMVGVDVVGENVFLKGVLNFTLTNTFVDTEFTDMVWYLEHHLNGGAPSTYERSFQGANGLALTIGPNSVSPQWDSLLVFNGHDTVTWDETIAPNGFVLARDLTTATTIRDLLGFDQDTTLFTTLDWTYMGLDLDTPTTYTQNLMVNQTFITNWNQNEGGGGTVPEPGTWAVLAVRAVSLLLSHRRH